MNVAYLSRVIHFDRDLSANSDIPEHAALRSEIKTFLSSRRRQHHPGLAVINRDERAGDEARRLAGLSFRTDIYNHVAFVDPERQFITYFGMRWPWRTAAASASVSVAPVDVLTV